MRLLLIDNYDSFTYNLAQQFLQFGVQLEVRLNDKVTVGSIAGLAPDAIVISPGPGRPENAGVSMAVVERYMGKIPILGVCLGHQAIGQVCGATIVQAPTLMHGKTSSIVHDGTDLFEGLPAKFDATRYHSLVIDESTLPDCLEATAHTPEGVLMALRHRQHPVWGVQFHPESILTDVGADLLQNFLRGTGVRA
ncbi:MAG: aminodeoxychorismate/anthranilate synthase component II [Acidobacteriota bacterium]|nr:aminodeoxychorismate/anthranilate synthase component II [Acidobacteriota bacterium]MDH3784591.1 aminodeoxychorismate/anthranilate synthase component II [Acidobacteriota bacterium]